MGRNLLLFSPSPGRESSIAFCSLFPFFSGIGSLYQRFAPFSLHEEGKIGIFSPLFLFPGSFSPRGVFPGGKHGFFFAHFSPPSNSFWKADGFPLFFFFFWLGGPRSCRRWSLLSPIEVWGKAVISPSPPPQCCFPFVFAGEGGTAFSPCTDTVRFSFFYRRKKEDLPFLLVFCFRIGHDFLSFIPGQML